MARGYYDAAHPQLGWILINYAFTVQHNQGPDQAEPGFREALALFHEAFGEEHRRVARALTMLGDNLMLQDRPDEGLQMLQEALEVTEAVFGPDHPRTARLKKKLANAAEHGP